MSDADATRVRVAVDGRELSISNLTKPLYPEPDDDGMPFTKGDVIDYYARIADAMVPHLAGRCITLRRYPNGSDQQGFFEKRCPGHRPAWIGTALGPGDRNGEVGYCRIEERAALVWAANMAALELHVPMALAEDLESPTMVVFDLDPGPPATIVECSQVALWARELLAALGLEAWAKTSGSKGMQLYVPLNTPCTHDQASDFAHAVGQLLEQQHPGQVLTNMAKAQRPKKVFVDWSQNSRHKTTIGVYSLRARPRPTVSTPVTWDEVSDCADGSAELRFEAADVLERIVDLGDLFAPVLTLEQSLPIRS
jgi:bifunctional non-homologous end joining protein LigD